MSEVVDISFDPSCMLIPPRSVTSAPSRFPICPIWRLLYLTTRAAVSQSPSRRYQPNRRAPRRQPRRPTTVPTNCAVRSAELAGSTRSLCEPHGRRQPRGDGCHSILQL